MKKSAVTEDCSCSVKDFFTEAATTETVLTKASPTISAEAVEAVRRGVRCAFRLARRPGTERVMGRKGTGRIRLMRRLAGAAIVVDRLATPRNNMTAPIAELPRVMIVPPGCTNNPILKRAMPTSRVVRPTTSRLLRCRAEKPSSGRIAATGGIRLARIAGTMAAVTVTPIPINTETKIVRSESVKAAVGKAAPAALKSAVMPWATPSPPRIPSPVAMMPMIRPSPIIMARIC